MFVLKSTYDTMARLAATYHRQLQKTAKDWNKLVAQINEKGGEEFLLHGTLNQRVEFSDDDEIDVLIRLVHPDKHNDSAASNEMTKRLLAMRKQRGL